MWTILIAGGALGLYLWTRSASRPLPASGLKEVDGALYFDASSKLAIMAALPTLSLVLSKVQPAKPGTAWDLEPAQAGKDNASFLVNQAIATNEQIVCASWVTLLSLGGNANPNAPHRIMILPSTPAQRLAHCSPGSSSGMAILFDPSHPLE